MHTPETDHDLPPMNAAEGANRQKCGDFDHAPKGRTAISMDKLAWLSALAILFSRLLMAAIAVEQGGDDGRRYLQEGMNIASYGVFSTDVSVPPTPTAHDLPLYPAILAVFFSATGDPAITARIACIFNAILFSLAAVAIFSISARLLPNRWPALASMWAFALLPETLPYSVFHMPESLFLAFFIWAHSFLLAWLDRQRASDLVFAFGLLGLSVLAKPISVFYAAVFGLLVVVFAQRQSFLQRVLSAVSGTAIVVLVLCPWLLRNWLAFGVPGLSTITGTNLYEYNYRMMLEDMGTVKASEILDRQREQERLRIGEAWRNPFVRSARLGAIAKKEIASNLPAYLRTVAKRHPRLYLGTGVISLFKLLGLQSGQTAYDVTSQGGVYPGLSRLPKGLLIAQAASWVLLTSVYLLFSVGLWRLLRMRRSLALCLILFGLAYFAVVIGPVTPTRYRLAMDPFLSIGAGFGAAPLLRRRLEGTIRDTAKTDDRIEGTVP